MRLLLAIWLSCCVATPSLASFVANRGVWNDLSEAEKLTYVIGAADRHLIIVTNSDGSYDPTLVFRDQKCLYANKIGAVDLVQLVEDGYTNIENWSRPAAGVLVAGLGTLCSQSE